ncbi:MAG: response regulator [Rhizobiales bacterium]|nr:response regulator [Hyphomicrobiales bacterium]
MMGRQLSILVVDDDADNANSMGELFETEGHRATVVDSGEAAIEAFRHQKFDVAFMDVMMPGKNGVESFLEIRKLRPAAKVYMMTGYSVEQLLQQAMDHGALGVLSKPIDTAKVLAVLAEIGSNGIVIVAEDDPDFGLRLEEMIRNAGRACHLVRDGSEALGHAESSNVLIFDLKAPLIQGMEVYSMLREAGRTRPTIIITASGADYHDTLEAMRDVAITGILNKPFDPMSLLNRLDHLVA